jgi:hypothetical protein
MSALANLASRGVATLLAMLYKSLVAGNGSTLETGTATNTGDYKAIVVLEETVFDAATTGDMVGLGGATLPAGAMLLGHWSVVKLTSGSVIIYNR